jgi:hypothetical protein
MTLSLALHGSYFNWPTLQHFSLISTATIQALDPSLASVSSTANGAVCQRWQPNVPQNTTGYKPTAPTAFHLTYLADPLHRRQARPRSLGSSDTYGVWQPIDASGLTVAPTGLPALQR